MLSEQTLIISGAGPVGLFCALKLAQFGISTVILDPILSNEYPWVNERTIALSYGSIQLLKQVGVDITSIQDTDVTQVSKIQHVHISIQNKFGACDMYANDYNVDALGYVISYSKLCHALYKACLSSHNICFVAKKLISHNYNNKTNLVDGYVEGGAVYSTPFLIVSEGSKIQQQYNESNNANPINNNNIKDNDISLLAQQYAHVGWVNFSNLPAKYQSTAFERFTSQGPLALLPYKYTDNNNGNKYNYALVWCNFNPEGNTCTIDNLYNIMGWRCGKIDNLKIEQHFNLKPQTRNLLYQNNAIYIGNSAQSLHPVAGQGLNLGFRQAYTLVENIINNNQLSQFLTQIQKRIELGEEDEKS